MENSQKEEGKKGTRIKIENQRASLRKKCIDRLGERWREKRKTDKKE